MAISSWSGAAMFNIVRSQHYWEGHKTLKVGFAASVTDTASYATAHDVIAGAMRYVYGLSEGGLYFERADFYLSSTNCTTGCGGSACSICLVNDIGGGAGGMCSGGVAYLPSSKWAPGPYGFYADNGAYALAHELSHCHLVGDRDEYGNAAGIGTAALAAGTVYDLCGHTIMGTANTSYNLCYYGNHARDPDPARPPGTPSLIGGGYTSALWDLIYPAKVPFGMSETPDMSRYWDFDFKQHGVPTMAIVNDL